MGRLRVATVILTLYISSAAAEADAVLSHDVPTDLLAAEHRSESGRSAEPDSFLDSIASLFGGGPKAPPRPHIQNKVARPGLGPVNPVYRGPGNKLQQQESVVRPQSVVPPPNFNKLQSSSSNIKRQTTGQCEL